MAEYEFPDAENEAQAEKLAAQVVDNPLPAGHPGELKAVPDEEMFALCNTTLYAEMRPLGLYLEIRDTATAETFAHLAMPRERIPELMGFLTAQLLKPV